MINSDIFIKELFKNEGHAENIYNDKDQLMKKIEYAIKNIHQIRDKSLNKTAQHYDWRRLAVIYDSEFEKVVWFTN